MKLISSLIASFLAFTCNAQNDTSTTEEPMDVSTTQMYSTSTTEEIVFDPVLHIGDDPITEFGCDYQWMGQGLTNDEIEITICGYTEIIEDEDDTEETTEIEYVAITLDIPSERWNVFGIKTGDYNSDDGYSNYMGYNIIIPIHSDDIDERYYKADKTMIDLENSIIIYSDIITTAQRRKIRLVRPKTVGYEHLNNTFENLDNLNDDLYFDFANFDDCGDSVIISVQYGSMDNVKFRKSENSIISGNYQYREAATEALDEEDGEECSSSDTDYDHASTIMIFGALIIGFIAMLF